MKAYHAESHLPVNKSPCQCTKDVCPEAGGEDGGGEGDGRAGDKGGGCFSDGWAGEGVMLVPEKWPESIITSGLHKYHNKSESLLLDT